VVIGEDTPLALALAALVLTALAEWLHARRVRRVARLAFGPGERPAAWARLAPALRVAACAALAWGLATLVTVVPKRYSAEGKPAPREGDWAHVLMVLDVSPSMRLGDAGPSRTESRMARARELMESFFDRVPIEHYRVSVVAVYNGAKPVVIDTRDFEVVRNILGDLPMHFAFPAGKTRIFDGLEEAARMAKPWNPRSTTLILVTDGDTVPATGMPRMPASVRSTIVVGVGDPRVGKFIDGRQSRQDVSTLRQIAARLGGEYHDGNEKQIPTALIADATGVDEDDILEKLSRREYALIAATTGAGLLALLPLLLALFGTAWRPGTAGRPAEGNPAGASPAGRQPRARSAVG
jgi:Ca-activated chloride channel family protein